MEEYTDYNVEGFWSEFGYEPVWHTCYSSSNYEESLSVYNNLLKKHGIPMRLVKHIITKEILVERP